MKARYQMEQRWSVIIGEIAIKDLNISYNKGKSYVLKDLDLEIRDGEFCVFLGPSGCGKSTAMYSIAGLLHPAKGEIRFGDQMMTAVNEKGKETTFIPPQERNIAMVFQEYALYPNMTVRKNMSFALETKNPPPRRKSRSASAPCPPCWDWMNCWTAGPPSFPAASVSVWLWAGPWSGIPRFSCWTSPWAIWMPSSGIRFAMS